MKLFNRTFILIAIATSVVACGGNETPNDSDAATTELAAGETQTVDYAVEGMVCAMGCAATIQKEVADIDGVTISEVNYEDEKAHFEFDPSKTTEAAIKAKIATIADGQYVLSSWEEKEEVTEEAVEAINEEEVAEEEESMVQVSLPSFKVPNLFSLLLNQL
ncbi:MAG: heavy metal-associated domain-containing protein [Vicingaceae bacterium]|nr:heavy metal-associated domain-containing protein [Vicingaceae bacterium]